MKRKEDRQKRALQATTIEILNLGEQMGLTPERVSVLRHALVELGWMPRDVDPLRALETLDEPEAEVDDSPNGEVTAN